MGNDNVLTPITDATVHVIGSDGSSFLFINSDENPGSYTSFMQGKQGISYHVEIKLRDDRIIHSSPAEIQPSYSIDSLDYFISREEILNDAGNIETRERILFSLDTHFSENDSPYFRWRASGVYEFKEKNGSFNPRTCYVKDNLDFNNIVLINSDDLSSPYIIGMPLIETTFNHRFNILYSLNTIQYRISEDEYIYWKNIEQLINIDGTLFDPPPAAVVGNLVNINDPEDKIQGYFSVTSSDSRYFFIDVTQKGEYASSPCDVGIRPSSCDDCRRIINSTVIKPTYWPR